MWVDNPTREFSGRRSVKRRTFLKSAATGLAGLPLLTSLSAIANEKIKALGTELGSLTPGPDRWRRVRAEFNCKPGLIHLNCGTIGATPRPVTEAHCSLLHELESSPYHHTFEETGLYGRIEGVREKAAAFLLVPPGEVALTANTTEGMNAVATGINLREGDEILTSNHEHGGGMVGWQYLAKHRGIKIVQFKIPPPAQSVQEVVDLVATHLTPRTRVCSLSHVDCITGMMMPLAQIAALTNPKGILFVCDGAQAPGMVDVDVKALGVDAYASSSHKWMLAPKGTGLLYIRKEVQSQIHPVMVHSGFNAYSASVGTRSWPQLIAHGLTMDFHNAIGRPAVQARCRELSVYLKQRLAQLPHLRCLTPADASLSSPGVVTYSLNKGKSGEIVKRLQNEHDIWVKLAAGTYSILGGLPHEEYNALRFSTHIFNDEAQIDRTVEVLRGMLKAL